MQSNRVFTPILANDKVMLTPTGGIAIKVTNKTGGASVKGEVVQAGDSVNASTLIKKEVVYANNSGYHHKRNNNYS